MASVTGVEVWSEAQRVCPGVKASCFNAGQGGQGPIDMAPSAPMQLSVLGKGALASVYHLSAQEGGQVLSKPSLLSGDPELSVSPGAVAEAGWA